MLMGSKDKGSMQGEISAYDSALKNEIEKKRTAEERLLEKCYRDHLDLLMSKVREFTTRIRGVDEQFCEIAVPHVLEGHEVHEPLNVESRMVFIEGFDAVFKEARNVVLSYYFQLMPAMGSHNILITRNALPHREIVYMPSFDEPDAWEIYVRIKKGGKSMSIHETRVSAEKIEALRNYMKLDLLMDYMNTRRNDYLDAFNRLEATLRHGFSNLLMLYHPERKKALLMPSGATVSESIAGLKLLGFLSSEVLNGTPMINCCAIIEDERKYKLAENMIFMHVHDRVSQFHDPLLSPYAPWAKYCYLKKKKKG